MADSPRTSGNADQSQTTITVPDEEHPDYVVGRISESGEMELIETDEFTPNPTGPLPLPVPGPGRIPFSQSCPDPTPYPYPTILQCGQRSLQIHTDRDACTDASVSTASVRAHNSRPHSQPRHPGQSASHNCPRGCRSVLSAAAHFDRSEPPVSKVDSTCHCGGHVRRLLWFQPAHSDRFHHL